ncbi:hypothetical protein JCM10212_003956 [Sporobolomyces blumeae]
MDGFMNLAKQGYAAYQNSQNEGNNHGNNQQQQQQQYGGNEGGQNRDYYSGGGGSNPYTNQNSRPHEGQGGGEFGIMGGSHLNSENYRPQGNQGGAGMFDQSQAVQHASSQQGGGDSGLFSQAMSFLNNSNQDPDDVDEEGLQNAHHQVYQNGAAQGGNMGSSQLGAAAAMNAFKQFTQGNNNSSSGGSSGGDFKSQLIGKAMSEAAKLFDQNGGSSDGDKQNAVNSAAATVMKLLLKSQMSGTVGGGNSGGLGQMLSMASKFM